MAPALVGRAELLERLRGLLGAGTPVALVGRRGIGTSALLDELGSHHAAGGGWVLRVGGVAAEQGLAHGAVRDLFAQLPDDLRAPVDPDRVEDPQRLALELLQALAGRTRVLILVDDGHLVDTASLGVLAYACRRLRSGVATLVALDAAHPVPEQLDLPGLREVEVPPLDSAATIGLLAPYGVGPRAAQRLHVESGGVPALALALGGAVGDRPLLLGRPTGVPAELERALGARIAALPDEVVGTLVCVALLLRPTVRQLERAGRADAEEELRRASRVGLVRRDDPTVRLVPPVLGRLLAERAGADVRAAWHRRLAEVATSEAERARHVALADPRPDADLARGLARHAHEAAARGERGLAADLCLLAARHATAGLAAERAEWLALTVEHGAVGDATQAVYDALEDFWDAAPTPEQRVRVRLSLLELAGAGSTTMEEALTAARADAGTDERLLADVLLQRARWSMGDSRPVEAGLAAEEGVRLLRRAGDAAALAAALPVLAVARRWTGRGEVDAPLEEALALGVEPETGRVHTSPAYMAARFALYDDRLDDSLTQFRALLARAERGPAADRMHLLRSLVEVAVRRGDCETALHHAGRAAALAEQHDVPPHSVWFVSALAELAGGGLDRGLALAVRGAEVAETERDNRYLQRHLILIGHARLRRGESGPAAEALRRVEAIEEGHRISDPTVNRWQADLVSALVALGDAEGAAGVLLRARRALDGRRGTDGVAAQLDRVEAEVLTARGETQEASVLLDRSEKVCRDLGLGIDIGRAMLTRAHLERRRRRAAASREALVAAHAHFTGLRARPWVAQIEAEQQGSAGAGPAPGGDGALSALTDAERGVALAVASGATNRETAERLWLSVKTVEAALTRVYRKLGVRSRTELAALLREHV
ncbi:LuxR family transcriptional regulator [Nocardioides sp. CFH 31398]|uniref:LuxR family transcriptional regulator n=1 Tax=Nocardioides sp. CFH 31398 TaxID=2919579 RepID=UPI001F06679D|nr:LuxR family transcriptional regulator [Nocardioides sp. CFH 31398]MCH1867912.1 LuxR C-terminal-related transcriptional regulator [Nocardioides sp. CFH 31398]